jgi:hypothetical protein
MLEFFYVIYFTFIGSLGHFLVNRIIQDLNSKKVKFNNYIEIIYFDRVENKSDYWYSIDELDNFYNEFYKKQS